MGKRSVKTGQRSVKTGQRSMKTGQCSVNMGQRSVKTGQRSVKTGQRSVKTGQRSVGTGHEEHWRRAILLGSCSSAESPSLNTPWLVITVQEYSILQRISHCARATLRWSG